MEPEKEERDCDFYARDQFQCVPKDKCLDEVIRHAGEVLGPRSAQDAFTGT